MATVALNFAAKDQTTLAQVHNIFVTPVYHDDVTDIFHLEVPLDTAGVL